MIILSIDPFFPDIEFHGADVLVFILNTIQAMYFNPEVSSLSLDNGYPSKLLVHPGNVFLLLGLGIIVCKNIAT